MGFSTGFSSRFGAPALSGDHDRGAEADPAIKIKDVRILHADAAIGDEPADRRRVVGAMDGVFTLTERERGCPHGVSAAAAGNDIRQVRLVVLALADEVIE